MKNGGTSVTKSDANQSLRALRHLDVDGNETVYRYTGGNLTSIWRPPISLIFQIELRAHG